MDISPILRQQNAVRQDFGAKSAANTFSKTLSQKRGSRDLEGFQRGFRRDLPKFGSQFGARGLSGGGVSSGVQRSAMRNYLGDYTRNYGAMQQDIADQQTQYDFNQANFTAERDRALADLHAQKQALIAQTALQINGLKPYLGGG